MSTRHDRIAVVSEKRGSLRTTKLLADDSQYTSGCGRAIGPLSELRQLES
jgi:hypothetical protein